MPEYRIPIFNVGGKQACVVVTINPDEAVTVLRDMEVRLKDKDPLWNQVGAAARKDFARKFAQGGNPRWAPLADRTKAHKLRLIKKGAIPPKTKTGQAPRRLLQDGQFTEGTILIRTGALRDSWVQKGARGHIEAVEGGEFFVGSQLTLTKILKPGSPQKHYHILTKKGRILRARGQNINVLIPLARFHEEGTKNMPARSVAVNQSTGDSLLDGEGFDMIEAAAQKWVLGSQGADQ